MPGTPRRRCEKFAISSGCVVVAVVVAWLAVVGALELLGVWPGA